MWFETDAFGSWSIGAGAVAHSVLALLVTLHVLRKKRDVGAAIAWMGLVWLSPFIGSGLYFAFGINRVQRRARRLRRRGRRAPDAPARRRGTPQSNHLAALERAAGRITGRDMTPGNSVRILRSGDEAYGPMIAAIDAARHSVALASYIFNVDESGETFIAALVRAHERGVAVRVLIDGIGGGYFLSPAWRRLRRAGVPAARFLRSSLPWRMPILNLRNHKKILCIDGLVGFTGGLNIADENLRSAGMKRAVRDTHFRFEGPVVEQLNEAFAEDWFYTTAEDLDGEAWFPETIPAPGAGSGDVSARVVTSGPDDDFEKIELVVLHAISCARKSIKILSPYFLPHDGLITALQLAAMRGVEVDILVPATTDHPLVDWARRAQIRPLVQYEGCQVFLSPPPFEHSKLMVIDEIWGLIGSANWDARSFRLNFELNVEVHDGELVRRISEAIDRRRGPELTADQFERYPFLKDLRDNAARLMLPYL